MKYPMLVNVIMVQEELRKLDAELFCPTVNGRLDPAQEASYACQNIQAFKDGFDGEKWTADMEKRRKANVMKTLLLELGAKTNCIPG